MNQLNDRERELVAIGAAIASNCVPCVEKLIPMARSAGVSDAQIKEAVKVAEGVRRVPARNVLRAARELLEEQPSEAGVGCGCAELTAST